jgi:hypothetical protein
MEDHCYVVCLIKSSASPPTPSSAPRTCHADVLVIATNPHQLIGPYHPSSVNLSISLLHFMQMYSNPFGWQRLWEDLQQARRKREITNNAVQISTRVVPLHKSTERSA